MAAGVFASAQLWTRRGEFPGGRDEWGDCGGQDCRDVYRVQETAGRESHGRCQTIRLEDCIMNWWEYLQGLGQSMVPGFGGALPMINTGIQGARNWWNTRQGTPLGNAGGLAAGQMGG